MTDDRMRWVIANANGFNLVIKEDKESMDFKGVPDYPNDLNAIRKVVESNLKLTAINIREFIDQLWRGLERGGDFRSFAAHWDYADAYSLLFTSARQWCEAYIKSRKLWECGNNPSLEEIAAWKYFIKTSGVVNLEDMSQPEVDAFRETFLAGHRAVRL